MTAEQELIRRLALGDRAAFRELVETHKKRIFFQALDMVRNAADAEDISQDVFLKVFRSFGTFKRDAKLGSWLYRITYNTCIDHLRKKTVTPESMETGILEQKYQNNPQFGDPPSEMNPAALAEWKLLQVKIESVLTKISPQERAVFLMRHREDLSLKEIADILELSVGSVKSYLFRAIRKLQKELNPGRPEPEASHE